MGLAEPQAQGLGGGVQRRQDEAPRTPLHQGEGV
jgi:hypothetical protein